MNQLGHLLGLRISITEYKERTGIPRYLLQGRKIYRAVCEEMTFFLCEIQDEPMDSRTAAGELEVYQDIFQTYTAFVFSRMSRQQRDSYIRHNIPFVCLPEHVYLPFLGVVFSDHFPQIREIHADRMNPVTQALFLMLLYQPKKYFEKSEAATLLQVNPTYITRATQQLKAMDLITEEREGRYVRFARTEDGMAYVKKAMPYLTNPVKNTVYVRATKELIALPSGEESALSDYGMLNPPDIVTKVCDKKHPLTQKIVLVDEPSWEKENEILRLELWQYDPAPFAVDARTDVVSLYCTLRDSNDARIQKELDRMLETYQWQ